MQGSEPGPQNAAAARKPGHQADQEDRRLIDRVKAGDHEAFDLLFQRYFAIVSRQAIRLTGNREEAEEVVQEVFLTVYEKAHTFRGTAAFSTWLYRVTANAALTKLRRRKKGEELSLEAYLPRFREDGHHLVRPVVDWSNELEAHVASEERQRLIQQALDMLAPMDKAVVVLSDLEGFSDREIASALGLSVSAVKARLHRSRLALRGKLAASLGYSPS
jgi:RNA polymerase sigma-70 factor (ECF subfamily)